MPAVGVSEGVCDSPSAPAAYVSVEDAAGLLLSVIRDARHLGAGAGVEAEIVIPIYNAFPETVACVDSVCRRTDRPFRLTLLNDGSRDPRVSALLALLGGASPGLRIVDRAVNRGFVATVNEGFALAAPRDVIILNSDTVVSTGWLGRMLATARSRPRVATVTPLTNAGTICSAPDPWVSTPLPAGYDVEEMAGLIAQLSFRIRPEVPTGVGFCMFVSRESLDVVGGFDEAAFGRGYGEENDFCQRAIRAGFVNLIADDTFVYHADHASFGPEQAERVRENLATVQARHPDYIPTVQRLVERHPLHAFHAYLKANLDAKRRGSDRPSIRVLHVVHGLGGGTDKHVQELAAIPDPRVLTFVLRSDGRSLEVEELWMGHRLRHLGFPLRTPLAGARDLASEAYREAFDTICWALNVNLIHVHQVLWNTLDIADVARARQIPYLFTAHDYYAVCPRYTLLDPDSRRCSGCAHDAGHEAVKSCMADLGFPAEYLERHRAHMAAFLEGAARIFTPSDAARGVIASHYPALAPKLTVVEHGHEWPESAHDGPAAHNAPAAVPPLNVAVIGRINEQKGIHVIRALLEANRRDVVFHCFGLTNDPSINVLPQGVPTRLHGSWFVYHGVYDSTTVVSLLRRHHIHVGLQSAVWEETFSYTVSEFARAGVPVIAGDFGAPGERIRRYGLGWVVPDIARVQDTLEILYGILDRPQRLSEAVARMQVDAALRPMDDMYRDYVEWYARMTDTTKDAPEPALSVSAASDPRYVSFLAMSATTRAPARAIDLDRLASQSQQIESLEARLRSPRYWVADRLANVLVRLPIVWPLVSRMTDAVIARRQRTRG